MDGRPIGLGMTVQGPRAHGSAFYRYALGDFILLGKIEKNRWQMKSATYTAFTKFPARAKHPSRWSI